MNRPPPVTYIFGNGLVVLATWGLSALCLWQWWQGMLSDVVPFIALLVTVGTANAHQSLTRYKNWKRAWDAMSGVTPRKSHWGMLIGVIAWMLGGSTIANLDRSQPETLVVIVGFAVGSVLLLSWICLRERRHCRPRRRRPGKLIIVSICLPLPRCSPGPEQFSKDLPILKIGSSR